MEQRTAKQQKALKEFFEREGSGDLIIGYDLSKGNTCPELFFLHPAGDHMPAGEYDMVIKTQIEKAKAYTFVPDCMIELYSLPLRQEVSAPLPDMSTKEYIYMELLPYIHEIGLAPEASVNLRNAVFAQEHGISMENGNFLRVPDNQINQLLQYHMRQEELAKKYGHNPIYNLPIHAIETSKGVLFFSNSE